jgi:hypothetical protein
MGWDSTALQNAIDKCNDPNNSGQAAGVASACPYLTVTTAASANTCKISPIVNVRAYAPS